MSCGSFPSPEAGFVHRIVRLGAVRVKSTRIVDEDRVFIGWSGRHNSEDEIGVCRPEYHAGHPDKAGCDGDCEEVPADVVVLGVLPTIHIAYAILVWMMSKEQEM